MPNTVAFNASLPEIGESERWFKRSMGLIPCNTQTLAKGYTQYVEGVAPKYLYRGKGARVFDVDENEYLDYNMGIGPISLGYAYPAVDEAIKDQLQRGITFSLVHPLEVEVAELIQEFIPNAESVRYSKTGAEATSAAIRIARAFTGRDRILACGYHGWHDWYAATLARNAGIPQEVAQLTQTFNYNDYAAFKALMNYDVAAVILEPVTFDEPDDGFLYKVQDLCHHYGTLLIFDEMWTGFRMAEGGAQEYFGVLADLATFSKAIANGMPLSVITGRHDVMQVLEDEVFFFNTFGGEALSLAAAKATLTEYQNNDVIGHIWELGNRLRTGLQNIIKNNKADFLRVKGYPYRLLIDIQPIEFDPLIIKSYIQQELIRRGILWSGTFTLSYSHTEADIDYTLRVLDEVVFLTVDAVKQGDITIKLAGKPIQPSLRPISNFARREH